MASIDYLTPSIEVLSPENKTYNTRDITLDFRVNEPAQILSMSFDGQANVTITGKITLTDLPEGSHTVTVYAENIFKLGSSDTVQFTVDTFPPSISLLSPENKTYGTTDISLDFRVNEAVSQISYVLDGQENWTIVGNTTLTGLANGDHNLTVYAQDNAGNIGASETISFSVEVPFPTTFVAAASVASVSIVGAGLLIYFKKRKR